MKITLGQLRQLIREQVEEIANEGFVIKEPSPQDRAEANRLALLVNKLYSEGKVAEAQEVGRQLTALINK